METVILNETPRRTAKNYGINNIKIEDFDFPKIQKFGNVHISSNANVTGNTTDLDLKFGIGNKLTDMFKKANQNIIIDIDKNYKEPIVIEFELSNTENVLVDVIKINAKPDVKANVIIKYKSGDDVRGYHNGICSVNASENSDIQVVVLNLLNKNTQNYYSISNKAEENANIEYIISDFGGEKTITNYYCNLYGDNSQNTVGTMYIGKENQILDLNYIVEAYGKKANVDMEIYGALKDKSKKNFKGTIDFKTGSKKAIGNENEYCMLLSNEAKAKSLPMLLCSEDDVQGNHSNSAGKIEEEKLYYIMTKGISEKEAKKLIVKAQFNGILNKIKNEELKNEILQEIDNRLD